MGEKLIEFDHLQKLGTASKQYIDSLALQIIDSTKKDLMYISNPNLLINHDFRVPINQKGEKVYSATNGYAIDVWMLGSNVLTFRVENGYIRISRTIGSSNPSLFPRIELDSLLFGRICTASLIYRTNNEFVRLWINPLGSGKDVYVNIPKSEDWNVMSTTFTVDETHLQYSPFLIQFASSVKNPDNFFDIMAIKLELGNKQTLARQENDKWVPIDPPPNPQQELAKCQRYQLVIKPDNRYRVSRVTQDAMMATIPLQTAFRVTPTISDLGANFGVCDLAGNFHDGFEFSVVYISDVLQINAVKQDHGVTDGYIVVPGSDQGNDEQLPVILDANL